MTDGPAEKPLKTIGPHRYERPLAVATVLFANAWIAWAWLAADNVRTINTTRLFSTAMMGDLDREARPSGTQPPGTSRPSPLHALLSAALQPPGAAKPPAGSLDPALRAQTAWVEGTVHWWDLGMNVVGGVLALAGLAGIWSRWRRILLLVAAVVILLATAATLVCLWMLMAPHLGGLPLLSRWTFAAVGASQSFWGFLLLAIFARRPVATFPRCA